jgi:endonuclease/exonuclease/phosphatase family metal-dependent hydrolase
LAPVKYLILALGVLQVGSHAAAPWLGDDDIHAIVGEPARRATASLQDGPLTIVSWNIAQGARYELVRDALRAIDADVYLLQEVDLRARRSGYRDVARDLANDLGGLNWVFAGEFQELSQSGRGRPALTGQAILSRHPIAAPTALRFRNQARLRWMLDPIQPRRGGRIALRAESYGVLLYNAHVESAKDDDFRHRQVDELVRDWAASVRPGQPVVLAGDLNTDQPPERSAIVSCLLSEGFVDALGLSSGSRRTSVRHAQPLDWIFVSNATPDRARVIPVGRASDHYPLEAELIVPAPAPAALTAGPGGGALRPGGRAPRP